MLIFNKTPFLSLFLILPILGFGQESDTVRVMHYNLLNYRNTTQQCTESTNSSANKDANLAIISAHVKPDILTVNEMGAHWLNPNKILTNALNTNGVSHFDQAEFANNGFSSLTNMLFFNNEKFEIYKQEVIEKDKNGVELVRVIDVYTLYFKDKYGLSLGDTTFITCIVAHLKAGSGSDDKVKRALMTEAIMDYLKKNKGNHSYLFLGDINIKTSSEECYINLIEESDESIRFRDPTNSPGSWYNNSNFANLHTQSTHVSDTRGGCFSGGGMDDRFDIILCGKEVINQSYRVGYIDGTYKALGQDSRRFNGDLRSPSNSLVPKEVSKALYEMSDHLPVIVDLEISKKSSGLKPIKSNANILVTYPIENVVLFEFDPIDVSEYRIINSKGEVVIQQSNIGVVSELSLTTDQLSNGVYIAYIVKNVSNVLIKKFIIKE
jgi:exonuclease III